MVLDEVRRESVKQESGGQRKHDSEYQKDRSALRERPLSKFQRQVFLRHPANVAA